MTWSNCLPMFKFLDALLQLDFAWYRRQLLLTCRNARYHLCPAAFLTNKQTNNLINPQISSRHLWKPSYVKLGPI